MKCDSQGALLLSEISRQRSKFFSCWATTLPICYLLKLLLHLFCGKKSFPYYLLKQQCYDKCKGEKDVRTRTTYTMIRSKISSLFEHYIFVPKENWYRWRRVPRNVIWWFHNMVLQEIQCCLFLWRFEYPVRTLLHVKFLFERFNFEI